MEIEIDSKRNNPLLNRTEVHFTIKHQGEGTPNREIIRSELAEKLNAKKENIIVNTVHSSFGDQEITGYAKVYSSPAKSKDIERDYILRRNKLIEAKGKEKKKTGEKPAGASKDEGAEEKPVEPTPEVKEEKPAVEEPPKEEEKPIEEPPAEPEKKEEPTEDKPAEEPKEGTDKGSEQPAEEKKEES